MDFADPLTRGHAGAGPSVDIPSGRVTQYWFFDTKSDFGANSYERCCDGSLHLTWSYYTCSLLWATPSARRTTAVHADAVCCVYTCWRLIDLFLIAGTGPGAIVHAGGLPFESMSVRLLLHDSVDVERKSLGIREMQRTLAPQLREAPVMTMINDISTTAIFRQTIIRWLRPDSTLLCLGTWRCCLLCIYMPAIDRSND